MNFPPIAVVGQGCVLPGALTPQALWSLVREGGSALAAGGAARWRLDPQTDRHQLAREIASDVGGHVVGFEPAFDPGGFHLAASELRGLDPVFLWTLHAAREALRSAGMEVGAALPRATLVLGNLSYPTPALNDLAMEVWADGKPGATDPRNRFMSGLPAHLVAQALGFGGGAFALDAACASSLYAIKLACQRLQDGAADLALAGGVNHADGLFLHGGFSALHALSASGQSRPFHRDADGLVPAQGAALILLERLDDAIAKGRAILGVIRGVGLSNDGRSRGLMVPAEEGQVRALRAAYAESGLSPRDISLVECHATGTVVGDGAEVRSMRQVFEGVRGLSLGSLKSNVGHLITASGAASVIKVLAAMREQVRPPMRHADAPIAELDDGMFRLLRNEEPWESAPGVPRRAAVSNFGFGGNNAHLILEEWTGSPPPTGAASPRGDSPTIAVVAQAVRAGAEEKPFAEAFLDGSTAGASIAPATSVELDAAGLRFPPADLRAALAQQTLLLAMAQDLQAVLDKLPRDRTTLLIGMQCDAEAARHALRWRGTPDWLEALPHVLANEGLSAAAVVGCMPNIVANRLSHQFDIQGPSFTVSSEEGSGLVALALGARALRSGEMDAAVIGAIDLCSEPVAAAASSILPDNRRVPGDAAVLLVLKRHADALRDGDEVLALLPSASGEGTPSLSLRLTGEDAGLTPRFGHAHAAAGLLHFTAAVVACSHQALPSAVGPMPWLPAVGRRHARVHVASSGGQSATADVHAPDPVARPLFLNQAPRIGVFAAADAAGLVAALQRRAEADAEDQDSRALRIAITGETDADYEARVAQCIALLQANAAPQRGALADGIHFGGGPMAGELGFVYTGAAGAYPHMGRDLALAFPELVDRLARRASSVRDAAGWVYTDHPDFQATPSQKLWGASYLAQLHTELTRGLLGLQPGAAVGYCSGETNSLFALGAWSDLDGFRDAIDQSQVYQQWLCGEFACLRAAWHLDEKARVDWSTWRLRAPLADVRAAVAGEPRAHLVIVNTHNDVVVAGEPEACARVAAKFPRKATRTPGYDFVMHSPEAREYEDRWRALHTRPTAPVPGVRFYTHSTLSSYTADTQTAADALTGQAMNMVDFPALVERAWADGVRVFIEHGPHAGCTNWIGEILGDRPHVAIALDRYGVSSLSMAVEAAARLFAAGVPVQLEALRARLLRAAHPAHAGTAPGTADARSLRLKLPAHPQAVPRRPQAGPAVGGAQASSDDGEWMAPPPALGAVTFAQVQVPPIHPVVPRPLDELASHHARLAELHRAFLRQQTEAQTRFIDIAFAPLARGGPHANTPPRVAAPVAARVAMPVAEEAAAVPQVPATVIAPPPPSAKAEPAPTGARAPVPRPPTGPRFDRAGLEIHAGGEISKIFGEQFRQQDGFARQVRMPQPPLLLADRVLGIAGEAGGMGLGTIWTETDVTAGAYYLHEGRMPAGILVESGQADLMLISWLGADFLNRGERVYRLLGCELKSHGELPKIGDTLHYEISVDGHAEQDGIRLFFFHYNCWVHGTLRMSVRGGQAGFFTTEELAASAGILWSAETALAKADARLDAPVAVCTRQSFGHDDLTALIEGRVEDCFGSAFHRASTHTRTPMIAGGRMRLLDDVTHFDAAGGPWKRGYLRARLALKPDHWFFDGHFKNDPCMPGTLMLEGGLQAMQILMTALGHTLDHDGARFEPVREQNYSLRCRGQATPASKEVVYEIFVEEIIGGAEPVIYADILGSVDGRKAFHCKRMGLRLAPAWPLDPGRMAVAIPAEPRSCAVVDGFRFDHASLLACAWGVPSSAFGPMYARFDGTRRVARLPGPPYHFMSNVKSVSGPIGGMQVGSVAKIEYDVPPGAWYFAQNNAPAMPFPVLLEAALQPCGWLASYVGGALASADDLYFRNLDGTGTQHAEIPPGIGTVTVTTKFTSSSTADAIVIMGFDVTMHAGTRLLYSLKTVFGFFPGDAMRNQAGLPMTDAHRARLVAPGDFRVDLAPRPARYFGASLRLPTERLAMLDRITGFWPDEGLGRLRAEKDVNAKQWFFKAHFYQDPVQPGSLGIEALLQAVQALAIELDLGKAIASPRFETQAVDVTMRWKYRGQVTPDNDMVVVDVQITEVKREAHAVLVVAEGSLWVDGKRIYETQGLGVRIIAATH